ncbi:MAG: winged helix-turn-helix domain-containing protein, partial [Pseudomonadales bacterium]
MAEEVNSSDAAASPFRLNGLLVEPALNRIDGQPVDGKHMAVLCALKSAAPEPLARERLLDLVWDRVVVDNVVHQAIAQLRRSLGDDSRNPRFIETVPRIGYRLIARVAAAESAVVQESKQKNVHERGKRERAHGEAKQERHKQTIGQHWGPWLAGTALALLGGLLFLSGVPEIWVGREPASDVPVLMDSETQVLVVLDVQDLSPDGSMGWLADGVSVEIRRQIGAMSEFEVPPRALSEQSRDDADLIMDGVLRGATPDVEIVLELTDLSDGVLLWRKAFRGRNDDPLELQHQVATSVVRYFDASLLSISGPTDTVAYEFYLRYLEDQWGGDADAETYWLQKALQKDPTWANGWEFLAHQMQRVAAWRQDTGYLDFAREAIANAKRTSGDPQFAVGEEAYIRSFWEADLSGGERMIREWRYGNTHKYVHLMLASGLCSEALAAELAWSGARPYDIGGHDFTAMAYACLGDADGAVKAATQAVRLMPPRGFAGTLGLIWGLPRLGRFDEARALGVQFDSIAAGAASGSLTELMIQRFIHILDFEVAMAEGDRAGALAVAEWFAEQG